MPDRPRRPSRLLLAASLLAGCGIASGADKGGSSGACAGAQPGTVNIPPPGSGAPIAASGAPSADPSALASGAPTGAPASDDAGAPDASAPGRPAGEIVLLDEDLYPDTIDKQREALFRRMAAALSPGDGAMERVKAIFAGSKIMGQGNPKQTKYPMTRKECRDKRAAAGVVEPEHPMCGAPFMVPIFDPSAGQTEKDAKVCVDEYEFPNVPCEHPVVWVSSREAEEICGALGKRLCDAHEWEGACAGAVHSPDAEYAFGKSRRDMKELHNRDREIVWSYGLAKDHKKCGTTSKKNKSCSSSGFRTCGSNTYPAGSFPECKSPFGAYDLHGNAAEHMSLPMKATELGSAGGKGVTEMKGSWFIFSTYEAHPDDCRWRAPDWHATKVMDRNSHANYHLGFRCCKDLK